MTANMIVLPRELTINILAKLPCKAILCCKAVCKDWLHIVTSDPLFAKIHFDNEFITLVGYKKKNKQRGLSSYKLDPCRFDGIIALGRSWDGFCVVNSCKGFLLMVKSSYREPYNFGVYNPLINETVFLPNLPQKYLSCNWFIEAHHYCGLGFSPVTKRFKVVVCVEDIRGIDRRVLLLIHTLGDSGYSGKYGDNTSGAWRMVSLPEGHMLIHTTNKPVELNGVLHWHLIRDRIVCFDVEKEELGQMLFIPRIGESGKYLTTVGVYAGLLCLGITVYGNPDQLEMWVMKEYGINESWMLIVVINLKEGLETQFHMNSKYRQPKLVEILDSGEMIFLFTLLATWSYRLFSYDPIKECFEKLCILEDYSDMTIDFYTPSFFSLKDF